MGEGDCLARAGSSCEGLRDSAPPGACEVKALAALEGRADDEAVPDGITQLHAVQADDPGSDRFLADEDTDETVRIRGSPPVDDERAGRCFGKVTVARSVGMRKAVSTGRGGTPNGGELASVEPERIANIVEANGMGELRIQEAHHMTPRREGARFLIHLVIGSKPTDIELSTIGKGSPWAGKV